MIGDDELRRIFYNAFNAPGNSLLMAVGAVREAVTADWKHDRDAAAIRLDATQHALEISEAQREELREKLAAADREVAEHRKHVSIIMSRLQAAKKTATRPVSVHFDCTAEEAWKVYSEHNGERFDSMTEAMNYLARRAVVEVPEGVPSALELTHEWLRGGAYGVPPIQFALDRLAPLLQPSASVPDSIPAETLEQLAEIAFQTFAQDTSIKFATLPDSGVRQHWSKIVAAILRAARPYCDLNVGSVAEWVGFDSAVDVLNKIDSRIRYTVEVPPAECPTCAKVKEAIGVRDE